MIICYRNKWQIEIAVEGIENYSEDLYNLKCPSPRDQTIDNLRLPLLTQRINTDLRRPCMCKNFLPTSWINTMATLRIRVVVDSLLHSNNTSPHRSTNSRLNPNSRGKESSSEIRPCLQRANLIHDRPRPLPTRYSNKIIKGGRLRRVDSLIWDLEEEVSIPAADPIRLSVVLLPFPFLQGATRFTCTTHSLRWSTLPPLSRVFLFRIVIEGIVKEKRKEIQEVICSLCPFPGKLTQTLIDEVGCHVTCFLL
jgi:hypothetical protein